MLFFALPHKNPHSLLSMSSPAPHNVIDPSPLTQVVEMLVGLSLRVLGGGLDKRALATLTRQVGEARRGARELRRVAVFNRRVHAMARLASDPAWRAQIRRELGGAYVIECWRRKLRGSQFARQVELREKRAAYILARKTNPDFGFAPPCDGGLDTPPKPKRERRPVKTDSSGLFRLAPVPTYLVTHIFEPRVTPRTEPRRDPFAVRGLVQDFAPIPLMPDDLAEPVEPDIELLSNSQNLTLEDMEEWAWDEASQDFLPPLIFDPPKGDDPPPKERPFIRRL